MLGKVVRVLAGIYLAYIALAVLLIMPAANFLAPWYVQENYGRELRADIILFNPFTLNAEVRGAALAEPDGSPFAGLDQASVNLSLASLVREGLVLDELSLRGLRLHVRRTGEETFNFSDLLPADSGEPEPASGGEVPGVTIRRLVFTAERIELTDEVREEPFSTHYDGIDISVTDLSTIAEEGKPYKIAAVAESGGELYWEGTVSIPGAQSEGQLRISGLSLHPFWRFARPWLNFALHDGQLSVQGNYSLSWGDELDYTVSDGKVDLASLEILPLDPEQLSDTALRLGSLSVSGVAVAGGETRVDVGEILVDGLNVAGWSEGAQVSLAELFAIQAVDDETVAADDSEEASPWEVALADIRLENSDIQWRSEYTEPPLMHVSAVSARVQDVSWPVKGSSPLSLQFSVNEDTHFKADGTMVLGNGEGSINYQLQALPLTWFNPNLPSALKASITDGQVDVVGALSLSEFLPVKMEMDGSVTNFAGTMEGSEESLTRWEGVRWTQLKVNLDQRQVSMEKLLIHAYEGRVHIAEDGSVNASKVWQEEVGDRAGEIVEDLELDEPWQVEVAEIVVSDSVIDFMDESLPIPFRTVIGDVNGEVLNINSAPGASTSVDIKGSVDGYAPVTLTGSAVPLAKPPALDLALTFTGVDMVMLTPYSGTYAGYAIERGLLNLDLAYSLEDNRLKGKNNVVIDQLKLGENMDSEQALDLPLELALALLTDMNGVIDLKVPVEGDVNDPEFALGSVISSAFINLLTKAVTAPFALLGSLVGSEDDLQRVSFPVGSSEINNAAEAKLSQLNQALGQRPTLILVISGQLNLEADRERLQRDALEQQLAATGVSAEDIAKRGPGYTQAVEKRYRALGSGDEAVSFSNQYKAVIADIDISEEQLRGLSQARAAAVKDYLVNDLGLPADRAVIEQAAEMDVESQVFSGAILDLDS